MKEISEKTKLLSISGPIFVEMFLNILINNVDTVMLGRFSQTAVGAVGNANQIMNLFIVTFNIISSATNTIVAQYLGAKQRDKMNQIYTLSFAFNLLVGVLLSSFLCFGGRLLLALMKVPENMMGDALVYTKIVGGCLFLHACFGVMGQILRCNGFAKVSMYISFAVNILNIGGNYLFLYGALSPLGLGVAGAAISTSFARLVALAAAIAVFYRCKIGRLSLKTLKPFPFKLLLKELKIGVPTAGENIAYSLAQIILLSFVNNMGDVAVNARVLAFTLLSFSVVYSNSVALGTQIITGHLVGAGKDDAAYRRVLRSLVTTLPVTVVVASANCLLSPLTLRLFGATPEVIALAQRVLLFGILMEIGRTTNIVVIYSLKSAGDYLFPVLLGVFSMWIIGISTGYLCGIVAGLGVVGVFMGTMADECFRAVVVTVRWLKGGWRNRSVVEK